MKQFKGTEDYILADLAHVIHPLTLPGKTNGVIFVEGHGTKLKDTNGKEYLDFTSGLVNVNIGHGRTEVADAAYAQMKKFEFHTIFWGLSHTAVIECASKLAELTPDGLKRFFFCSGGSEANETAIKFARLFWRANGADKYKIISLQNSYHGVSFGPLSATALGRETYQRQVEPLLPGFSSIPSFYCYRCSFGKTYPGCGMECAHALEDAIQREGAGTVAAFIAEPVQGSAGMVAPPPEYWPLVRQICSKYNVLLIADEVMTGFGRTGKMFAVQHWNVTPDIMSMAKGITSGYLPFGAVAVSDRVHDGLKALGRPLPHLFTYSGHPVCCAAATKNMEILVNEKLADKAAQSGAHLVKRLRELLNLEHVGDAGGLGLMTAFELVADKARKTPYPAPGGPADKVLALCRDRGLILRLFANRISLTPPLSATRQEIDQAVDIVTGAIAEVTG